MYIYAYMFVCVCVTYITSRKVFILNLETSIHFSPESLEEVVSLPPTSLVLGRNQS